VEEKNKIKNHVLYRKRVRKGNLLYISITK